MTNATTTAITSSLASNRIFIYEPTPIIGQISEHRFNYNWFMIEKIEPTSVVSVLN